MVTGDRRLFSTRSFTTCLAFAKAASVASLLPNINRKPTLPCGIVLPDLGGAVLGGFLQIHDRRQRLVVHLHELGGITRLRERLGHDEGDAIADEAHLFGVEHRLEGAVALGRAEIFRHQMGGKAAELVRHGVGAGQDAQHPGRGLGLGHVDSLDARMRVRRQHRHAMAQAGQADVIDIAPLPEQEALVLHPPHRLSDTELGHSRPPLFTV